MLDLPGRRVARVTAATMLFITFAAVSAVLAAQVDDQKLAAAGAAPPNGALIGAPPIALAIVLNSVGTVVVRRASTDGTSAKPSVGASSRRTRCAFAARRAISCT